MSTGSTNVISPCVKEQPSLWDEGPMGEDPDYLSRQLVTYIGNKRSLLHTIENGVEKIRRRLGKDKLRLLDAFSGSGVVSRLFKAHADYLIACDLESYASVLSRCYLTNRSTVDIGELASIVRQFNNDVSHHVTGAGFIEELYAPQDENNITHNDRVFYTKDNARRLDSYRRLIEQAPAEYKDLLLGPLLSRASVHANTSGVFKGFHKDRHTGKGQFGGGGRDALTRILGTISLDPPILSRFECHCEVVEGDINDAVKCMPDIDIAYLDPPYNQHPYGSNYFMLNLITSYKRPQSISRVSGIPTDWKRSGYNVKQESLKLMEDLVENVPAKYILISFNNEGYISTDEMESMLSRHGKVDSANTKYNAFRGSRSFANRPIHVTEHLFTVEKY